MLQTLAALLGLSVVLAAEPDHTGPFPVLPPAPTIDALIGLTDTYTEARSKYLPIIAREAERHGLPPAVAETVVFIESGFKSGAVGSVGEVGLMQIRPGTAALLGYKGGLTGLFDPETNVHFGVMYLAGAWELADGDLCRALMKYRAGHGESRITTLSWDYCRKARARLAALGSPLANGAESASAASGPARQVESMEMHPGAPAVSVAKSTIKRQLPGNTADARFKREVRLAQTQANSPGTHRTGQDSKRFWAAHEARIREITSRLKVAYQPGRRSRATAFDLASSLR